MTYVFLITGFLGAGKTTFLKDRLSSTKLRTGVLVNDFGKVNFDSMEIKKDSLEIVELSNGSIFCSCLKDYFIDGLVHLIQLGLDEIYIESSGLADPSDMNKVLSVVRLKAVNIQFSFGGTICLVDGLFFPKVLPKMLSVERQVRHSHLIIINKCDLINLEQLEKVKKTLTELNPRAQIIETSYGKFDWQSHKIDVFDIVDEVTTNKVETRNKNLILHILSEPDPEVFRAFLNSISNYFFRIKGFIHMDSQLHKVDLVNLQIQIEPSPGLFDNPGIDQLACLTSQGLDSISQLAKMADKYLPGIFRLEM